MSKAKTFRPWNPEQTLLLPPSPVEWLPEHHLVFFLLDLATELDLSAIYAVYEATWPAVPRRYRAHVSSRDRLPRKGCDAFPGTGNRSSGSGSSGWT